MLGFCQVSLSKVKNIAIDCTFPIPCKSKTIKNMVYPGIADYKSLPKIRRSFRKNLSINSLLTSRVYDNGLGEPPILPSNTIQVIQARYFFSHNQWRLPTTFDFGWLNHTQKGHQQNCPYEWGYNPYKVGDYNPRYPIFNKPFNRMFIGSATTPLITGDRAHFAGLYMRFLKNHPSYKPYPTSSPQLQLPGVRWFPSQKSSQDWVTLQGINISPW